MEKRRDFKEIIQSGDPSKEHIYIRGARGELIPATKDSGRNWVILDEEVVKKFYPDKKAGEYTFVHTHSHSFNRSNGPAIPTEGDLKWFNSHGSRDKKGKLKGYFIVQRDRKTGEIEGVTYVAPATKREAELVESSDPFINLMLSEARKFNMNLRFHPAEEYFFNKESGAYEYKKGYNFNKQTEQYEKKAGHSLEGAVASILIGFVFLFLLIKVPLTGFAISNSNLNNYKGGLFLIIGFLFSLIIYFVFRRKSLK